MSFNQAHALVIGVGSYRHEPRLNIPISVADAQAVASVLRDPQTCGYPAGQVTLLHDADATTTGILGALDQLAARADASSTVCVFYCGHGDYGEDGQYYLTAHDTRVSNSRVVTGSGITHAALLSKLRAIPAQRVLFIFNSCHSGEISPALGPGEPAFGSTLPEATATALLSTGAGRIIITACREGQVSYIGKGQLSIFTQALVDGLRGKGASSHGGYLSAFDLYTHVYYAVTEAVSQQLHQVQQPELTILKGIGPFAVSLFRGATSLGTFEDSAPLPDEVGVRQVSPQQSQRQFQQIINIGSGAVATNGGVAAGAGGVAVGGNVGGSIITGARVSGDLVQGDKMTRQVSTGGGAYIEGDVDVGSGDFVGRDQTVIHYHGAAPGESASVQFSPLAQQLYGLLKSKWFSLSELQDLCFTLDVDWDRLSGENKTDKARALVLECERSDRLAQLQSLMRLTRPNLRDRLDG